MKRERLSVEEPLTVAFDASASSDADGTIASYDWVFGDGNTGQGKTTTHEYTAAGEFTVRVGGSFALHPPEGERKSLNPKISSSALLNPPSRSTSVHGEDILDRLLRQDLAPPRSGSR